MVVYNQRYSTKKTLKNASGINRNTVRRIKRELVQGEEKFHKLRAHFGCLSAAEKIEEREAKMKKKYVKLEEHVEGTVNKLVDYLTTESRAWQFANDIIVSTGNKRQKQLLMNMIKAVEGTSTA